MSRNSDWIAWIGLGVIGLLLVMVVSFEDAPLVIGVSVVFLIVGAWRRYGRPLRRKWDLSALREIQENEEMEEIFENEAVPDRDEVVCLGCGSVYGSWLPVCPNCKRESGR